MRWATAILVSGAVGVAVIMAAFGALITWHNQPLLDSGDTPRLHTTIFPGNGNRRRRMGTGRIRTRRPGWPALAARRPRDRHRLRRLVRTRLPGRHVSTALPDTPDHHQPGQPTQGTDDQPVVDQRRRPRQRQPNQRRPQRSRRAVQLQRGRQGHRCRTGHRLGRQRRSRSVPAPARLHPGHQLPARQPLLAAPVDRVRLAHCASRSCCWGPRSGSCADDQPDGNLRWAAVVWLSTPMRITNREAPAADPG